MTAASLILRLVMFPVTLIAVGTIAVFGYVGVIEPFYGSFGNPPASLGWGDPATTIVAFAAVGAIGLLLVLVIWFVVAPIRTDQRQQFRR